MAAMKKRAHVMIVKVLISVFVQIITFAIFLLKGKAHLFEVLDTLYQELTACELLQSQPLEKAQSCQSLSNPLVISC